MTALSSGDQLPQIVAAPPGPRSRQLARELRKYEAPNITFISEDFPVFWREALGANVLDVDGNIYIDLTAGFGVAAAGHRNTAVSETLRQQLSRLQHGLGDIHPPHIKVKLLKRLSQIAPPPLTRSILASSGAEAVEAALKTARLASGRPGVLRFSGAYHGLTYGALSLADRDHFRAPFEDQLGIPTLRAPFPDPFRPPEPLKDESDMGRAALEWLDLRLDSAQGETIGAIIVEPIQGRGGVVVPSDGFLTGLRELSDRRGLTLIFDEILTGFGRTGRWFACEHEVVVPDILCVGKALTGILPFSACIGRPATMDAWPESSGEAIHTSTFLGHPLGCAAALAQIEHIKARRLIARSARIGEIAFRELGELRGQFGVGDVRGRGLLIGLDIVTDAGAREPDPQRAQAIVNCALRQGLLFTAGGTHGNVLTLTPPLNISEEQLGFSIQLIKDCLAAD